MLTPELGGAGSAATTHSPKTTFSLRPTTSTYKPIVVIDYNPYSTEAYESEEEKTEKPEVLPERFPTEPLHSAGKPEEPGTTTTKSLLEEESQWSRPGKPVTIKPPIPPSRPTRPPKPIK